MPVRKPCWLPLAMARIVRWKLTLLYNTSENHQKIAIAVASMWKKTSAWK